MERPGRPLGVSLAIIAAVLIFSLLPLLQVGLLFAVQQHFANLNISDNGSQMMIVGTDFMGIAAETLAVQVILACVFFIVALFAWRGRPGTARFTFMGLVVIYTAIKLASVISQTTTPQNLQAGISSMDSLLQAVSKGEFIVEVLVMLYVIWYMNRGPARAFYRGYYLPRPDDNQL